MTDQQNTTPQGSLGDEIREFGKSLGDFFKSAWDSEERKEVEEDITGALNEVADTFRQLADDITTGETGQQLKSEYEDLKERIDSGELTEKTHSEISKAIRGVKEELDTISDKWTPAADQTQDQEASK
ncbi:MAG: hypothetical protein K8R77_13625 [Anaerolineaceae bacterium]|nr:hypothetical protein [Anaerolineaceae bacterium]